MLFAKGPAVASRAAIFSVAAAALIVISLYTDWLAPVRAHLGAVATPFYWITNVPQRLDDWSQETLKSRATLQAENEALRTELFIHQRSLLQMAVLYVENVRQRRLYNSRNMLQEH